MSAPGPVLFVVGLILLAPGGLLSLVIVEKLLWSSGLTLSGMTWTELVLTLAINAVIWLLCARLLSRVGRRRREAGPSAKDD
jgi:membrane protein implicated in regulation of membrane protease activity